MKTFKVLLLGIIAIAMCAIMVLLIKGDIKMSSFTRKSELIFNKEYTLDEIKEITVNTQSTDIYIEESKTDMFEIKIYDLKKNKIDVNNENGNLNIEQTKSSVCIGICVGSNKIIIKTPKAYIGKFNIKSRSSDITSKLKSENDYEIDLTSGDIDILNAKSIVGKTTSGDLEIRSLSSYIKFKATSGDIEIDRFDVNKNSSIETTSGDVEIDELTNAYVYAKAKSGDIKVNSDRYAKYELNIKVTSGDINVN